MEAAAGQRGLASDSLEVFLLEFDRAVRDFELGASSPHEPPAEVPKKRLSCSRSDDSESKSASPSSSSLNTSEKDLSAAVASSDTPYFTAKTCEDEETDQLTRLVAKLGDTRELEAFIADLDQILKEM